MRNILIIVALLFGFSATYAQTEGFNGKVASDPVTLKTTVIKPLIIENVQQQTVIPTVIKGQMRDLTPDKMYLTFHISKELGRNVRFHVNFSPYPVHKVKLDGSWVFEPGDYDLEKIGRKVVIPNSGEWNWEPTDPADMTVYLLLDKIDATDPAVTLGTARFTAAMTGYYTGL